jgi:small subunit ribosomal protein S2
MKKYIFTSRNGIHIIDLQQTIKIIKNIHEMVKNIATQNKTILFVGTKKQAQDAIKEEAIKCGMPYVHHRWLGGILTNIMTIRQSINKYKKYSQMIEDGSLEKLSNKEASKLKKSHTRLSHYLEGIKDMIQAPDMLFVVDTKKEQLAIKEATKLGIPIIGVVDTNTDPNEVQHAIPGNDDAIRSIRLLCSIMANAVNSGKALQESQALFTEDAIKEEKTEEKTTEEKTTEKTTSTQTEPDNKETNIAEKDTKEKNTQKKETKKKEIKKDSTKKAVKKTETEKVKA